MEGLQAPRLVFSRRPVQFINFGPSREGEADQQQGAAAGAIEGVLAATDPTIGPMCAVLGPLCLGLVGAAAAIGAGERPPVSVEHGAQMQKAIEGLATSEHLARVLARRAGRAAGPAEYPRLAVQLSVVRLFSTRNGATFIIFAHAHGAPSADMKWKPTMHAVRLPTRPLDVWLAGDGFALRSDVRIALETLAHDIAAVYVPQQGDAAPAITDKRHLDVQ